MDSSMNQALKDDYSSLKKYVQNNIKKSITWGTQRDLFVQLGKMTFIFDFAVANKIDTAWAKLSGEIYHEVCIRKHFLGFDASTVAPTGQDQKKAKTWLEIGWHERYCFYQGKYSDATFANPSISCDVVEKRLKEWKKK
jgi:hypothetical protein